MNTTPTQDTIEARFIAATARAAEAHAAVVEAIWARNEADRAVDIAIDNSARANAAHSEAREAVNTAQWAAIRAAAKYASVSV
jgi:hypothetical protein